MLRLKNLENNSVTIIMVDVLIGMVHYLKKKLIIMFVLNDFLWNV